MAYAPIFSLKNKYEIEERGCIRRVGKKKPLRKTKYGQVTVCVDGKVRTCSIASLLWETHGIIHKGARPGRIEIWLTKDGVCRYFESASKAATFLAERLHYSWSVVRQVFVDRRAEWQGWRIAYNETERNPRNF